MGTLKLGIFFISLFSILTSSVNGQDSTFVLSATSFNENGYLPLPDMTEWRFHKGNDTLWASPEYDHSSWQKLDSTALANIVVDENRLFEGWFTVRIKLDSTFTKIPLYLRQYNSAATDIYIDGELFHSFGNTNYEDGAYKGYRNTVDLYPAIALPTDREIFIAAHFVELHGTLYKSTLRVIGQGPLLWFMQEAAYQRRIDNINGERDLHIILIPVLGLVAGLFLLIIFMNPRQVHLQYAAISISLLLVSITMPFLQKFLYSTSSLAYFFSLISFPLDVAFSVSLVILIATILEVRINHFLRIYMTIAIAMAFAKKFLPVLNDLMPLFLVSFALLCVYFFILKRDKLKGSKRIIVIGFGVFLFFLACLVLANNFITYDLADSQLYAIAVMLIVPITLLVYLAFWLKEMVTDIQVKAKKVIQISNEKKALLENQNIELERQVNVRTSELNTSLENLKSTQTQLIQSEKMASLGELTAGIAHEIQNPLNFVNNFSEVNKELIAEMLEEIEKGNYKEAEIIAIDINDNQEKINHHGKRADDIVKGMLQHSRSSSAQKELTDINALADEYLRLAYHGLRAKDKSFNASMKTDFDDSIEKINVVPQNIGRVILNLITNAFYVVNEKKKQNTEGYDPVVIVSTKKIGNRIEISVMDNGNGIPEHIKEKIFQPFFTTKPTGQGTGLGLSLSYDIVKAHGGELKVESKEGEGSIFTLQIPVA